MLYYAASSGRTCCFLVYLACDTSNVEDQNAKGSFAQCIENRPFGMMGCKEYYDSEGERILTFVLEIVKISKNVRILFKSP